LDGTEGLARRHLPLAIAALRHLACTLAKLYGPLALGDELAGSSVGAGRYRARMDAMGIPTTPARTAVPASTMSFRVSPSGPFDLLHQNSYFGGWPTLRADPKTVVMTFPVDGAWTCSAAVTMRQEPTGDVIGEVFGVQDVLPADLARRQALAALSLDVDGSGWPGVGERDPLIGRLQREHKYLRPILFHSAYEAAASFLLGHRLRISQARELRHGLAVRYGRPIEVGGEVFHAFPEPAVLAGLVGFPGVGVEKIARLRALADAVGSGRLDRAVLRGLPVSEAIAEVRTLPGVGPFFAQGIAIRGAGWADEVADDDITRHAVGRAYGLDGPAGRDDVLRIAETWRPLRMWAVVMLHVDARGRGDLPRRTFSGR